MASIQKSEQKLQAGAAHPELAQQLYKLLPFVQRCTWGWPYWQ